MELWWKYMQEKEEREKENQTWKAEMRLAAREYGAVPAKKGCRE